MTTGQCKKLRQSTRLEEKSNIKNLLKVVYIESKKEEKSRFLKVKFQEQKIGNKTRIILLKEK